MTALPSLGETFFLLQTYHSKKNPPSLSRT